MKKRKQLSEQEIEMLFDFATSKNVPYKDVQFEIVDHLATGIKELQSKEPGLTFEKALNRIYSRFPITGFAVLQLEKEKYIKRYWKNRFGKYMLNFFQIPRILLTLLLFLIFHQLFVFYGLIPMWIIGFSCWLFMGISYHRSKWFSPYQDNYLIVKSFNSAIVFYVTLIAVIIWLISTQGDHLYSYSESFANFLHYFVAFVFALAWIFTIATFKIFPEMLKEEINKKYQHLDLVKLEARTPKATDLA